MSRKKWGLRLLKLAILALVVWGVRGTLVDALAELDDVWHQVKPGWIALAGGLYIAGLLPLGIYWHRLLVTLGQRPRLGETLRAYYIGHLGKYAPGKALVVILRAGLIRGNRVDTSVAAASVFLETLMMMGVGAMLAAAILAAAFADQWAWVAIAVTLGVGAGLPTVPHVYRLIVRRLGLGRWKPALAEAAERLDYRVTAIGWLAALVGWWLIGLSLWAAVRGMSIDAPLASLPWATAICSLAMVAGFLSLVPGGFGVRDLILIELTTPYLRDELAVGNAAAMALSIAVLLRLSWMVSEVVVSGILYGIGLRNRNARDG